MKFKFSCAATETVASVTRNAYLEFLRIAGNVNLSKEYIWLEGKYLHLHIYFVYFTLYLYLLHLHLHLYIFVLF